MSNEKINIFNAAKPQTGEFFKFAKVGDEIQGTYVDSREGVDSYGNDQIIYVIVDGDGKVWNVGFRKTILIIHTKMQTVRYGQIVGFRFDESRPSKAKPGTQTKIIRIYEDPKLLDHAWIARQKEIEEQFAGVSQPKQSMKSNASEEYPEVKLGDDVSAVSGGVPEDKEVGAANDAINAILSLARTKGLTSQNMSTEEQISTIEAYTGNELAEENLTKVIIKLTSFTK